MGLPLPCENDQDDRREALSRAYEEHAADVTRLALRIVRNEQDAQDVRQQVFAQAWVHFNAFDRERGNFKSWLMCIARTRALDFVRGRMRRARLMAVAVPGTGAEDVAWSPHEELALREREQDARAALSVLPERAQRVIELSYRQGFSQREVSAALGTPLGTVKTLARQSLLKMRARIALPRGADASTPGPRLGAFTVEVPGGDEARMAPRTATAAADRLDGRHVVVVDDDNHTLALLSSVLQEAGADCTTCRGAREAVALLEAVWPDLLIADINMPDMDGYALIRRLRAMAPVTGEGLPALAFTACGREDERAHARLAGFDAHLAKPVHPLAVVRMAARLAGAR